MTAGGPTGRSRRCRSTPPACRAVRYAVPALDGERPTAAPGRGAFGGLRYDAGSAAECSGQDTPPDLGEIFPANVLGDRGPRYPECRSPAADRGTGAVPGDGSLPGTTPCRGTRAESGHPPPARSQATCSCVRGRWNTSPVRAQRPNQVASAAVSV
ncbi:hypothetical protein CRV15_31855 (plasmid) [Streptomyces clavuligerus]|nr:hypothetical protein D1794_31160 [Streptomyces clavuligerus]QCS10165.1 hypothetical protein CRV15_31855 [Streptomyces clavuligerus]